jgi:hypothetical protein
VTAAKMNLLPVLPCGDRLERSVNHKDHREKDVGFIRNYHFREGMFNQKREKGQIQVKL